MPSQERICKTCAEQIKRLSAKRFWSQLDDYAKRELLRHLHTYAHEAYDEERARVVMSEILVRNFGTSGGDVPTTDELWSICHEDPRDFESQRKPATHQRQENPNCEHCGGTGWEAIERGIHSGVTRCRSGCAVPARDAA